MEFMLRFALGADPLNPRRQECFDGLPTGETGLRATDAVLSSLSDPRYESSIFTSGSPPPLWGTRGIFALNPKL
jgi:hypothetical protein